MPWKLCEALQYCLSSRPTFRRAKSTVRSSARGVYCLRFAVCRPTSFLICGRFSSTLLRHHTDRQKFAVVKSGFRFESSLNACYGSLKRLSVTMILIAGIATAWVLLRRATWLGATGVLSGIRWCYHVWCEKLRLLRSIRQRKKCQFSLQRSAESGLHIWFSWKCS